MRTRMVPSGSAGTAFMADHPGGATLPEPGGRLQIRSATPIVLDQPPRMHGSRLLEHYASCAYPPWNTSHPARLCRGQAGARYDPLARGNIGRRGWHIPHPSRRRPASAS